MSNPVGRPPSPIYHLRRIYADRYGKHLMKRAIYPPSFIEQLERCKTEEARRILCGVSK